MASWSYRIVRFFDSVDGGVVEHYALHEVYYDDDGTPTGMSEEPVGFVGETRTKIVDDLIKAAREAQALETFEPPKEWKDGCEPATET